MPSSRTPVDSRRVWLALLVAMVSIVAWWWIHEPPRTRQLLWNSMKLAAGATLIAVPLGTVIAWLIEATDVWGRSMVRILVAVLLFLPLYLYVAGWDAGFGLQGWCPYNMPGTDGEPLLWTWRGAIWIHAMAAVPWVTLLAGLGLRWVDREWEEAAFVDAGQVAVFCRVTLPALGPWLLVAVLWILVWTAGEMTVTNIYQVNTLIEEVYTGYAKDDPRVEGGVVAVPVTVRSGLLLLIGLLVGTLIIVSRIAPGRMEVRWVARRPWPLGVWRWRVSSALWFIVLLLIGVPLGNLVYQVGGEVELLGDAPVRGWSLKKAFFLTWESPWTFRTEMAWSFAIAQLASMAAVTLALVLAWWGRGSRMATGAMWCVVAVCLALPGPVWGIWCGQLRAASVPSGGTWIWDQTIFAPWLGLTARCLPLACLVLWHALHTIPSETLQVAEVDGVGRWRRLWTVAVPQRTAALAGAWLLGFVVAWGDLAMSILTVPPGVTTLAIRIFGMAHYGVHDRLAGLCLANLVLIGILTLAGARFVSRWD